MSPHEKFNLLMIERSLKFHKFDLDDPGWILGPSKVSGKGIIATKRFNAGDIIFVDYPMVIGPRIVPNPPPVCVVCYSNKNLKPCTRKCSLLLCFDCENNENHQFECNYFKKLGVKVTESNSWNSELVRSLTPVRCLKFNQSSRDIVKELHQINGPQQGIEIRILKSLIQGKLPNNDEKFLQTCCCVLDANAFEVPLSKNNGFHSFSLRGLYPISSILNHSCSPNTTHTFGDKYKMIVRASIEVLPGQEMFTSYANLFLGTPARRNFLAKTKYFDCLCLRCRDPSENGTYLSGLFCHNVSCDDGILLPKDPLNYHSEWLCNLCDASLSEMKIGVLQKFIGQQLSKINILSPEEIIQHIEQLRFVSKKNHVVIQLKYSLIKLLGSCVGYKWPELSNELLLFKKDSCLEILEIIEKLNLGQCEISAYCTRELAKTEYEIMRKKLQVLK